MLDFKVELLVNSFSFCCCCFFKMLNRCWEYAFLELVLGTDEVAVVVKTTSEVVVTTGDCCEEGGGCCS